MSRPSRPLRTSGRFAHRPSAPDDFRGGKPPINPVVVVALIVVVAGIGVLVWLLGGTRRPQPTVVVAPTTSESAAQTTSTTPTNKNPSVGNHSPRAEIRIRIDPAQPYDLEYSGEFSDDLDIADDGKLTYAWNFGDGSSGTNGHGHKIYTVAGTYTVSLTVTDLAGATNTTSQTVHVAQPASSCIGRPLADERPGLSLLQVTGSFDRFADLERLWATGTLTVANRVNLELRPRNEWYALRFSGFINFPKDGTYSLFIGSDDGSRLILGDETLVVMDRHQGVTERRATFLVKAGLIPVRIDYFQGDGGQELIFDWIGPDIPRQSVPAEVLFHRAAE